MHEIKIKINGDGTVDTGSKTRLRIGVESEVNRVKFIFDVDSTIEGTYHYIKFLRDDISYIYRVHNKEIVINKSILVKSGIWLFSFISTDAVIVNKQLTGSYGFISEPTEAVVLDGILTVGSRTEESEALDIIYGMSFSELRIPDSVPSIGDYFMYESRKTFTLHIGAGVKSIGGYTFYKAVIPTLTFSLESQLQTLSDYAFYNITFENEICIPALSVVVTAVILPLISFAGTKLISYLNSKIKDNNAKELLTTATTIVTNAVRSVFQTYVDSLKASGTFDAQAQTQALTKAKDIALAQMSNDVKNYIITNYGDINNWLTTQIEATINLIKNK